MRQKKCKYCASKVVGRPDKVFCDNHCRSAYHNDRLRRELRDVRQINRQLIKNRSILKDFFRKGLQRVPSFRLLEEGFSFDYYTRQDVQNGKPMKFCYEIGYVEEESGFYQIMRQQ